MKAFFKDILVHYLSNATLVIYVPVLGTAQFQFPCRVIFDWFKLVSAHPPNSQPFKQKKCIIIAITKSFGSDIYSPFDVIMVTAL